LHMSIMLEHKMKSLYDWPDPSAYNDPLGTIKMYPSEVLIEKLREVRLRNSEERPYKDADISLIFLHTNVIWPTQRYVLENELRKIEQVRWRLLKKGIDIFRLQGYLETQECDILPPIIEWFQPRTGGPSMRIICDGQHRLWLARHSWQVISCVVIKNPSVDYYAYPLIDQWTGVEVINDLIPGYRKKYHICDEYKMLYRDFNTAFFGIGDSRPVTVSR